MKHFSVSFSCWAVNCLSLFSHSCDRTFWPKETGENRVDLPYRLQKPSQELMEKHEPSLGTEAETTTNATYWLVSRLTFSCYPWVARVYLFRDGTAYSGAGFFSRKSPIDMLEGQCMGETCQLKFPLLGYVELTTEASMPPLASIDIQSCHFETMTFPVLLVITILF